MSVKFPDNDSELRQAVRADTSYDDTSDELPQSQLNDIIDQALARLQLETSTNESTIYGDDGLSFALAAYTKMRSKAAVENASLEGYSIGAEDVDFKDVDPEDSAQYQMWAEDVSAGLNATSADSSTSLQITDGAGYVGENHYYEDGRHGDW